MTEVEPRCWLERTVLEKLEERGWQLHEAKRDTIDLDLSVSFGGVRGAIRFRNAFDVPPGETLTSAVRSPLLLERRTG